ncbi:hypothetical protein M434DRAFT_35622 [Hypoxylon sp. CO27-5]|nr:hypothetical protein M434DRAFT_35622 [Hypoxylon sp. CO27-5]
MELATLTGLSVTHTECACSSGIPSQERHRYEAAEDLYFEAGLSGRVGYRHQRHLDGGKRGNRGCGNSHICWNFRRSPVRMNRLLLSTTLFLYNIGQLCIGLNDGITTNLFTNNIVIAICLMLWDFLESMNHNSDHAPLAVAASIVIIEVIILFGLLALTTIELYYCYATFPTMYVADYTELTIAVSIAEVLQIPMVIQSIFIVYRAIANYLQKRRQQRQQYAIVFTRTGDPVVVISEPRHPDISASRLSADSLIQAPGQSDV